MNPHAARPSTPAPEMLALVKALARAAEARDFARLQQETSNARITTRQER